MSSPRRCFLLLVDGLRPDLAESELAQGHLPHLERLVAAGGAGRALTSFPSTTSVSYLPFLTGCTPGRCNVPSIRWLERTRYQGQWWRQRDAVRSYCGPQAGKLDGDLAPEVQTLFGLVPESIGILTMVARGLPASHNWARFARGFWGILGHYTQWHQPADTAAGRYLLRAVDAPAPFVFVQFPAVDGYTHQANPQAPRVLRALHRVDAVVGLLLERLQQREELASSLILVVSDHGASPVQEHLDLADWFRAHGVRTLSHPVVWTSQPNAAVMVAGNGSAMVYARPTLPRTARWSLAQLQSRGAFLVAEDLISALVAEPAVAFVAAERAPGVVEVLSASGYATVTQADGIISYLPESGDPLCLGTGFEGTAREWLVHSWDSPFPDAPFQLLDQFRSPRTGDLLVIANEGYDFRRRFEIPEHRSGHGSLIRAHLHTPLWSNQPLPELPLRTIDLYPTMLDWLGLPVPAGIDGELVWRAGAPRGVPAEAV